MKKTLQGIINSVPRTKEITFGEILAFAIILFIVIGYYKMEGLIICLTSIGIGFIFNIVFGFLIFYHNKKNKDR